MKILLFGKDGQLGWELQRSLAPLGEVVALGRNSTDFCGDFARAEALALTIRQVRPDVIVNAAAYTAVDQAESDRELANTVNVQAPGVLADEAEAVGAWLVHYSTDYVFNGEGARPWTEEDEPAPLNVYGRTKLEGEHLVTSHCSRHLVFRTSWVYAARGKNFAKTMLRMAAERDELAVIDDQFGAPTGAELLADVTAHAIAAAVKNPALAGLYHLAAAGETSWNGYARFIVEQARIAGKPLKTSVDTVKPVPTTAFPTPARRPLNSRLDTRKLQSAFGLVLPGWQQGVARMLTEVI